jgi:hypothetical protein
MITGAALVALRVEVVFFGEDDADFIGIGHRQQLLLVGEVEASTRTVRQYCAS